MWCLLTGFLPSSAAAFIYLFKPPYAIGSVPSLSGQAIAYRWRSLPRVRRHRASKPQGSSKRVLPWQVTIDQSICASLSYTHYWYKVGMLKVPADVRYRLPDIVLYVCACVYLSCACVSHLRPMGLNVLGYQSHLLQRCHPTYDHEESSHLSSVLAL